MKYEIFLTPDDNLQKSIDSAPENSFIHISPGIYRQKLVVRTPGITLIGSGCDKSILIYDDYARKRGADGFEYITFRSYTVAVCADGVSFRNLSVVNDAGAPEHKGQQIALSVYGDNFTMEDCILRSTQDTLFSGPLPPDLVERYTGFLPDELRADRPLRQQFRRCRIDGTVDFIFGCGNTLFEDCELRSLADARGHGFLAAPAHSKEQSEGFLFRSCRITCGSGVEDGSVYLARPWRDYGLARFENCTIGPHINPLGFDPWQGTRRDLTARFSETPPVPGRAAWINR